MANLANRGKALFGLITSPPQVFTFLPAAFLAAFWLGGESILILLAFATSLFGTLNSYPAAAKRRLYETDPMTGLKNRQYLIDKTSEYLKLARAVRLNIATFQIEVKDFDRLCDRFGHATAGQVMSQLAGRFSERLRAGDILVRLEGPRFGLTLSPAPVLELDNLLQISARLQAVLAEPFQIEGASAYLMANIGFASMSQSDDPNDPDLLEASENALIVAKRHGRGAVRAFSPDMNRLVFSQRSLAKEIEKAMDTNQIRPWFQPQIRLADGQVTGFEALARWDHPQHGTIPPAEFLPLIEDTGMSEKLSEVILFSALTSLSSWDKAELGVPTVSVNFSLSELQNPKLLDRIRRNLDRFSLPAHRLSIEILETVVARSDIHIVARNIRMLTDLGCRIELDDFGTGQSSIASIQRFSVNRLKVDRSFIRNICDDPAQQRLVGAIVTMTNQLNIDCLIEGVETADQYELIDQLGCEYAQGFHFAKPLPPEDVPDWLLRYRSHLGIGAIDLQKSCQP